MVSLYRHSTTDISLENLQDFERLFWMAAFKVIAQTKICSMLALKSPLLPQLMSFSFRYAFRQRPEDPE